MAQTTLGPNFYQQVFADAPVIVCCLAPDGSTVAINPAGERLTGYRAEELTGHNFWRVLFPEDDYKQIVQSVLDTLKEVDLLDYEMTVTTKEGFPRIISWSLIGRYEGDELVEIIGFGNDLTERRQAEQERERLLHAHEHRSRHLQLAAEVATSVSTLLDTQELIVQTVEKIKEAFDYYYVGLFLVDETGEYAELRAGTGQAGEEMIEAGHKLKVGDGSMIGWSIANGLPRIALDVGQDAVHFSNPRLPDTRSEVALPLISRGQRIGALTFQSTAEAAFTDSDLAILSVMAEQLAVAIENTRLYEQVQQHAAHLEKRVAERTAELTAVNKELEAFAYSVSHDLRAPLRAIDGFSQALLEDYASSLDAAGLDYLHRVRTATRRMGQLISDLLKLSRLTRGEMHRERVDLSTLASEVLTDLATLQPERQLDCIIAPGLAVEGDIRLLRVALENLLGNAWKFTSKLPLAQIEFGQTEIDGERVFFVRDNGAGFDMTYVDKLFGAFQRLHAVNEFEGTGIGLATVQRVIHRHGGRIWAEGKVEQGATFYFTLQG